MRANRIAPTRVWLALALLIALPALGQLVAPAGAATELTYVPQTGHYMRGVFRDFWDRGGGLATFGFPITEEYIDPASGRVVQYFERARFERASAGATSVALGALGREVLGARSFPPARQVTNTATRRYIPETRQIIQYGFKEIWETRGGRATFGWPLSGEIVEITDDGVRRTVQYFENARFEYHASMPAGQRVLLSMLGRRLAPAQLVAPLPAGSPPDGPLVVSPGQLGAPGPTPTVGRELAAPAVNAAIVPLAGEPGDTFTLSPAPGYLPGETVSVWANPRGQSPLFVGRYGADARGAIAPVRFTAPQDAALGEWAIVAEGNDSRRQAIGYFTLIGGPIGSAQPTPTAAPAAEPPVPRNVDAAAEPPSGPAGTVFFFDAYGFQPGEQVQVAVIAPDGRQTAGPAVRADQRGSIRDAGLFYPTAAGAPTGLYRMVAYGAASNKTSTAYFVVTP